MFVFSDSFAEQHVVLRKHPVFGWIIHKLLGFQSLLLARFNGAISRATSLAAKCQFSNATRASFRMHRLRWLPTDYPQHRVPLRNCNRRCQRRPSLECQPAIVQLHEKQSEDIVPNPDHFWPTTTHQNLLSSLRRHECQHQLQQEMCANSMNLFSSMMQ